MQITLYHKPEPLGGWFARMTIGGLTNEARDIEFPFGSPLSDPEPIKAELEQLLPMAIVRIEQ